MILLLAQNCNKLWWQKKKSSFYSGKSSLSSQSKLRMFWKKGHGGVCILGPPSWLINQLPKKYMTFWTRQEVKEVSRDLPSTAHSCLWFLHSFRETAEFVQGEWQRGGRGLLLGLLHNYRGRKVKSKAWRIGWQTQDPPRIKDGVQGWRQSAGRFSSWESEINPGLLRPSNYLMRKIHTMEENLLNLNPQI